MKKSVIAASLAALVSANAQADVVGVYLGGQVWDNQASGIFGESGNQTDFNLSDEQQESFFIAVEHPLPLIPNAKISFTNLDTTGLVTLTSDIDFANETFSEGLAVQTMFDVSYLDYTLYYEIFDNGLFSFDLGLSVRDIDGDITVATQTDTPTTGVNSIDAMIPMLYVSTKIGLPLTGLNLMAEGNFLSIGDNTLYDYQAGISYELIDNLAIDMDITLGYRALKLELDDVDNIYSDLDFKGVYAGTVIHF